MLASLHPLGHHQPPVPGPIIGKIQPKVLELLATTEDQQQQVQQQESPAYLTFVGQNSAPTADQV